MTAITNQTTGKSLTPRTVESYIRRTERLLLEATEYYNNPDGDLATPRQLADYLDNVKKPKISGVAYRQARSALRYFLGVTTMHQLILDVDGNIIEGQEENFKEIQEILDRYDPDKANSDGTKKTTNATSAKKKKKFTEDDFLRVIAFLDKAALSAKERAEAGLIDKSIAKRFWYAEDLRDFLIGNLVIGLRPNEYLFATISDDKSHMVVRNAKHTNGRAHGETRTLWLTELDKTEINCIENTIKRFNERLLAGLQESIKSTVMERMKVDLRYLQAGEGERKDIFDEEVKAESSKIFEPEFDFYEWKLKNEEWAHRLIKPYYNSLRMTMNNVSRKVFSRSASRFPTMYSTRHQVSANLKKADYPPEAIAAIMGHAIIQTASTHYGKTRDGNDDASLPMADTSDMMRVAKNQRLREERLAHRNRLDQTIPPYDPRSKYFKSNFRKTRSQRKAT